MNERRTKLEAVFHAAMDLASPEERKRYLSEACADDPELRREVDELLKSAAVADPVFRAGREACHIPAGSAADLTEKPGDNIGRYKLLEKIGEGGMGVVYMAEQEEPVRRKVALKIIKLGMDTRQVVARFEAERQALALMDHPNIAKVLDAGATDSGRPYFVMELVQGVLITRFCDENRFSPEDRIRLFIPVCQAIQSAHQKGVIHRDLKPSNVLVTLNAGVPHPMVIHFGVAKATNQKLTEKTLFTNFATMIGTPAYMSPEQAEMSKLGVDTRSDIYSLGVLLYELLTDTTPFPEERLRSVAYGEMQRIIAEEEPERPSTRLRKKTATGSATPLATPHSSLATDLDWIVMKCLEKDRARRYDTANNLAADIQRHLNNEAVFARPPNVGYRFEKLVQRNKVAFAAAAVIAAVLVAAAVLSTWQAIRATRAEQAARAVKEFLLDQVLNVNPYVESQPDPARAALLERMARDLDLKFTNQPSLESELRMKLGGGFNALGDSTNALLQFQKALEIRQRTVGPHHSDTLWSLSWVVQIQMLSRRKIQGRDSLENAFKEIKKSPHSLSSGEAEIVWTYGNLLCIEDGDAAKGLPYLEEGLAAFRPTANPRDHVLYGKLNMLARETEKAGRFDDAERIRREGMEQAEREFGADHILVAQFEKGLSGFLRRRGRGPEALPLVESAVPIYRRVLGTNHHATVDAEMLQAETLDQLKRTQEAGVLYATLYQRWLRLFPDVQPEARDKCRDIAQFFVREGRYEQAHNVLALLQQSFEMHPPARKEDHETFLQTELLLARTLEQKGRLDDAAEVYGRVHPELPKLFPRSRSEALTATRFFRGHNRTDDANTLLAALMKSFETNRPSSESDFTAFIEATAAAKNWQAAAALCRSNFNAFSRFPSCWRVKATAFLFVGDHDGYREATAKALRLATTRTNINDQRTILNIALLDPTSWSDEERMQVEKLAEVLRQELSASPTNENGLIHRTLAATQLRLGQAEKAMDHLEEALQSVPSRQERGRGATLKALCLHQLGHNHEARVALAEGDELMRSFPQESLPENFLSHTQLYDRILRREAEAAVNGK